MMILAVEQPTLRRTPRSVQLHESDITMCLGIPGKVIDVYEVDGLQMGKVDFGGVIKEACLAYVPDIALGDFTIIHVGFAINKLDEEEAKNTLALLAEMDMLADELPELDAKLQAERSQRATE